MNNTKVTLSVNECSEFHSYGESHEKIKSVDEAIRIWKSIPPDRLHGIKSIGICVEDEKNPKDSVEWDILVGNHFDLETLEYVPDILGNKKAQEMIKELQEKMPDIKVLGDIPVQLREDNQEQTVQNTRTIRNHR